MFSPGETVVHTFVIPFAAMDVRYVVVSYKKNGDIVLEKTVTSGFNPVEENKVEFTVDLSQEESLLFADGGCYTLQVNVCSHDYGRITSKDIGQRNGVQYLREVMSCAE